MLDKVAQWVIMSFVLNYKEVSKRKIINKVIGPLPGIKDVRFMHTRELPAGGFFSLSFFLMNQFYFYLRYRN